jgi:hypothetical protein
VIEPLAPGTATVKGKLTAKLDETSLTPVAVPAGTGVTFIISGEDLDNNPDPNFNYDNTVVRGTTDANGNFTVSLPARKKSISVEVKYDEFEYDATILVTNDQGFQVPTTVRKTFKAWSNYVDIVDGIVKVNDKEYYIDGNETADRAIIRGKLKGVFVDNVGKALDGEVTVGGSGYTATAAGASVPVTGGSGTGMTIYFGDWNNYDGVINNGEFYIVDEGNNYKIGDIVTVTTGSGTAKIEITNVDPSKVAVPANVVLTFDSNGFKYKVATNANGEYVVKVPAGNVYMSMSDFEYTSTYESTTTPGTFVTGNKIYGLNGTGFYLNPDEILEVNNTNTGEDFLTVDRKN